MRRRSSFIAFWILVVCLALSRSGFAQPVEGNECIDGLPCKAKAFHPPIGTTISLRADAIFEFEEFVTLGDLEIQTNGYNFRLQVSRKIDIKGTLTIRAFDQPATSAVGQAPSGKDNITATYNVGPNTDGQTPCDQCPPSTKECFACPGRPGGTGGPGLTGENGKNGKAGGQVALHLGGNESFTAKGLIAIDVTGQSGGNGGQGGNGGRGGNGEQGGKGSPGPSGGCSQEAQPGGRAGDGGDAGRGGRGGNAGDGGRVIIIAPQLGADFRILSPKTDAGVRGLGGPSGLPGIPGRPGMGGRGVAKCSAAFERTGDEGKPGRPNSDGEKAQMHGKPGDEGRPGEVQVFSTLK